MYWCALLCGLLAATSAMEAETMETLDRLQKQVATITRQLMMQQFSVDEQTRANGNSGLKRIRTGSVGTKPYYSASHVDNQLASMHDHGNFKYTIGLGELLAVLNGIEFRTRHNDFMMKMKSTTSSEYGATEYMPFPDVPPAVLESSNITEQAAEMREWFKAWRDQDYTVRDYRPYFKAALCYLEGMWTHADQNTIEESFESDRHFLNAKSWLDLQEKARFSAYSGTKDPLENFAYLPTSIRTTNNGTDSELVQWNYRILCHPIRRNLPTSRLNIVDDLKTRVAHGMSIEQYKESRAARFQVSSNDQNRWVDKYANYHLLDELMEDIPGSDNYPGQIEDDHNGDVVYPFYTSRTDRLNVARYHRVYRVEKKGALGLKIRRRSFSDENMFLAQTTNPKVAGLSTEQCSEDGVCQSWHERWSYAIPLEIVYLTPLLTWNPYNIPYRGKVGTPEGDVTYKGPNGKRDGSLSLDKAYDGTNSKVYYQTPLDFFEDMTYIDPADTTQDFVYMLDDNGTPQAVRASGTRIMLPNIPDVGSLRTRYSIVPVHGEGNPVWKELAALRDVMLYPSKHTSAFPEEIPVTNEVVPEPPVNTDVLQLLPDLAANFTGSLRFEMEMSTSTEVETHTHTFEMSEEEAKRYLGGESVTVYTSEMHGHSHELLMQYTHWTGKWVDIAKKCDGEFECWDGHHRKILRTT